MSPDDLIWAKMQFWNHMHTTDEVSEGQCAQSILNQPAGRSIPMTLWLQILSSFTQHFLKNFLQSSYILQRKSCKGVYIFYKYRYEAL